MFRVLVLVIIGIVLCVSVVPVITLIWEKVKPKKEEKEKIVYKFSQELFEAEYKESDEAKKQFVGRFGTDFNWFKNHFD